MPIEIGKRSIAIINDIMAKTEDFDENAFMAMTCMLIEEWCKQNGKDAIKYHEDCLNASKFVVETFGRY